MYNHAFLLACSLVLLLLPAGCYEVNVSFEDSNPETSLPPHTQTPGTQRGLASSIGLAAPGASQAKNLASTPNYNSNSKEPHQGTLRMSNQTEQPVRLVLLSRRSGKDSTKTNYNDVPAHWDFAPKEGSEKGLLLSLPNGNLKLEKGDILVAFAQDGSRRYWGPYVVDETTLPNWDTQHKEWQLILNQ